MHAMYVESVIHSFLVLIRSEFETTDTLEKAMASPAKAGLSSQPNMG
jgi:hypothetical protein